MNPSGGDESCAVDWQAQLAPAVAGQTLLVKLGGSLGREDTLPEDVVLLHGLGARVALVHGGGPRATEWLARLGKETRFVGGLRYTDQETLEVVRMVMGLANEDIVARIQAAGGRAIGLSPADDQLLVARARGADFGLVGEIAQVNPRPIEILLDAGYAVVVAPGAVAIAEQEPSSAHGGARHEARVTRQAEGPVCFLNVNADEVAGKVAVALGARRLIFLTDVDGISDGNGPRRALRPAEARRLMADGVIAGGMIPKVEACLGMVAAGRPAQIVDGRRPHAVLEALAHPDEYGTLIAPGGG